MYKPMRKVLSLLSVSFFYLLFMLLTACHSVSMATKNQQGLAKQFSPVPGKAKLYISRHGQMKGAALLLTTFLDRQKVAQLPSGTFVVVETNPGLHTLGAIFEESYKIGKYDFDAKAGEVYFIDVDIRWGGYPIIKPLNKEKGKIVIDDCNLVVNIR